VAWVWWDQERLLFFPQPAGARSTAPPGWDVKQVAFTAGDGTSLAGVLLLPPVPRSALVIYYGGNAEEAESFAASARETYGERALLLVNYRGYGRSRGRPGERELVADALALFDWAANLPQIDPARIALHGRSLGTGVAVQVAAARPARCVILTSPFSSARAVAEEIYPWLPIGLLMRHPFDSARLAPAMHIPVLILMGDADRVIPQRHSQRLAQLWGGPVEPAVFEGFGHNDIQSHPRYTATIRGFLDRNL
jgi:fermentation-respiration switch protein FrsA (DUF1100 family)